MPSQSFYELHRDDCDQHEYGVVAEVARSLNSYMQTGEILKRIGDANRKGIASSEIQACVIEHATQLGFHSERQGLFSEYATGSLRPDYFLSLTPGRGIILEVEKGKTLTNNMDLLDLWKCHICNHAQYLFLMVPRIAQNAGPKNVFDSVVKRMQPFFWKKNYVDVYGLFIFGY